MHLEVGAVPGTLCTAQADTLLWDKALKAASGWKGTAGVPTLFGGQVKDACQGQAFKSPGGVFNLKGVLTLFTQNNTNMQRSSKSIVVKQQGGWAALAVCPPGTRLAPAERTPASPARERRPTNAGKPRQENACGLPFLPSR